ncbi:MAG: M61 family metallopeptidase [Fimbriimonadaceae bacterium]|nr:M61 family metallopeptidase [Fimbriimonadaceae bacterium]
MRGQPLSRFILISSLALAALQSFATIDYTVEPMPDAGELRVAVSFTADTTFTDIQAPNWAPGSYRLQEMSRTMKEVTAKDGAGQTIEMRQPNAYTWSMIAKPGTKVTFAYTVPRAFVAGALEYPGPATYVYVVGRKEEDCRLAVKLPKDWKIATGLDPVRGSEHTYSAPTYDVFADCPVSMGDLIIDTYASRGRTHSIALRGAAKEFVDRDYLIRICKYISDFQADFFSGLPFKHYVWHFNVNDRTDGAGGLEHLNSTSISMAAGMGVGTIGVYSHEYFHLWNVKRIRSAVLGPFDYTQLPKTGALWWLEGVTDYYAHLLPTRYNLFDDQELYRVLVNNHNAVQNNAAHLEVSPHEASMRVGETNNGRGNSNGYRISYYNYGWVAGFCLDVEIRRLTGGKRSLDDVMKALWEMCKDDQAGFPEDEIRRQCIRFGGPEMGAYYDKIVMDAGDMPVPEQLARMGLEMKDVEEETKDLGFNWAPMPGEKAIRVSNPRADVRDALKVGDLIVAINGKPACGDTTRSGVLAMNALIESVAEGEVLTLTIKRESGTDTVKSTVQIRKRTVKRVVELPNATEEQKTLRAGWMYGKAMKPGTLFDHSK